MEAVLGITMPFLTAMLCTAMGISYSYKKKQMQNRVREMELQKEILQLEIDKQDKQLKVLEQENRKYDRIIDGQ
jgi:hypothetical protein